MDRVRCIDCIHSYGAAWFNDLEPGDVSDNKRDMTTFCRKDKDKHLISGFYPFSDWQCLREYRPVCDGFRVY